MLTRLTSDEQRALEVSVALAVARSPFEMVFTGAPVEQDSYKPHGMPEELFGAIVKDAYRLIYRERISPTQTIPLDGGEVQITQVRGHFAFTNPESRVLPLTHRDRRFLEHIATTVAKAEKNQYQV